MKYLLLLSISLLLVMGCDDNQDVVSQSSVDHQVNDLKCEDNAWLPSALEAVTLVYESEDEPIGTAFLMNDGYYYTAAHVVRGLTEVTLRNDFFERFGGGIGLTRLGRAWEMLPEEKRKKTMSEEIYYYL